MSRNNLDERHRPTPQSGPGFGSSRAAALVTIAALTAAAHGAGWDTAPGLPGLNGEVYAMTLWDDDGAGPNPPQLVAAGNFNTAGGSPAQRIARWNGTSWSSIGTGVLFNSTVNALAVFDEDGAGPAPSRLFAAGQFTTITQGATTTINHIAKWNGTAWVDVGPVGQGINSFVPILYVSSVRGTSALYAGGLFNTAGGVSAIGIAKWNGLAWSSLGTGTNFGTYAMADFNDGSGTALYAAGIFTTAGGSAASRIAKWNGSAWSPLAGGLNGNCWALTTHNDGSGTKLYAGGAFTTAGGAAASRVAAWNGSSWSALPGATGEGVDQQVYALASHNDGHGQALYAGGDFLNAAGVAANRIAAWQGNTWSPMGGGADGRVYAILPNTAGASGFQGLYAVGNFVNAGGSPAGHIARWTGRDCGANGCAPSTFADLGDLIGPTTMHEHNFAPSEIEWQRIVLSNSVTTENGLFLDINTRDGSLPFSSHDSQIAFFDGLGNLIATNDDDGTGAYSALSFGATSPVRPRADGRPGDGRDGPLNAGVYWLAVAGFDAQFASGWWAVSNSAASGQIQTVYNGPTPVTCHGTWTQAITSPRPAAREHHAMAYDSDNGITVAFGGVPFSGSAFSDTWEWNGSAWTAGALIGPNPGTLFNARMAYDRVSKKIVLFGGTGIAGSTSNSSKTWEYDTATKRWTFKTSFGPLRRSAHAMAFDPKRGSIILYGGIGDSAVFGDTWEWKGGVWSQLTVAGPPNRGYHQMTLDSSTNTIVLFGGDNFGALRGDTWEWNGAGSGTWTQRSTTGPVARYYHAMAPAADCGRVMLFGGLDHVNLHMSDFWEWNGALGAWTQLSATGPSGRISAGMVYHAATKNVLLFGGGVINNVSAETWKWAGPTLAITSQPVSQTVASGGCVTFSVGAAGSGAVTYQWFKNGAALANGGSISGAASGTLAICPASSADAGSYSVIVSDACCSSRTSIVATLAVQSTGHCVQPPSYMRHWWPFDELPAAATVFDAAGAAPGSTNNGATFGAGKVANALVLDGVDDYVSVPSAPITFGNQFTIDCWIYPTGQSGVIVSRESYASLGLKRGFVLELATQTLTWGWADGATSTIYNVVVGNTATVPLNQWSLVAIVVDRNTPAGSVNLYLNGVLLVSVPATVLGVINSPADLLVGRAPIYASNGNNFPGMIDELEIFERALTLAEIQSLYIAGPDGKCKQGCHMPWDFGFCIGATHVTVPVTVCNYDSAPHPFLLAFTGLAGQGANSPCQVNGPTSFLVSGPNPVTIPGGMCQTVYVQIARPVGLNTPGIVGCYDAVAINLDSGHAATCHGSVQDTRQVCPIFDPTCCTTYISAALGVATEFAFTIRNDGVVSGVIPFLIEARGMDMNLNRAIAFEGLDGGTPAAGSIVLPVGATGQIRLTLTFLSHDPFAFTNVVLKVAPDGDGVYTAITSIGAGSLPAPTTACPPCAADYNQDGGVDGNDVSAFFNDWEGATGCADVNQDGGIDGADVESFLLVWENGAC